jgi:hypothetical protein
VVVLSCAASPWRLSFCRRSRHARGGPAAQEIAMPPNTCASPRAPGLADRRPARAHPWTTLAVAAALLAAAAPARAWENFGSLFWHGQDETQILWIDGRYKLESGSYSWGTAVLGHHYAPTPGTVWQTGGSFTVNALQLGYANGSIGTYTLDGGILGTGGTGVATSNGWATFTQNGGLHLVVGELAVGGATCCRGASHGTYNMAGGAVNASTLRVGAYSDWTQSAGDASFVSGTVLSYGTLRMRGGTLLFADTLEIERAGSIGGPFRGHLSFEGGVLQGTLAVSGRLDVSGGDHRGLLDNRFGGETAINGRFSPDQGIANAGVLTISNNSWLTLEGSGLVNAAGGVLQQAGRVDGSAPWVNHGQATLSGELRGSGAVTNGGSVLVERALLLDRNGVLTNSGGWTTRATVVTLGANAQVLNQGVWWLDRSRIEGNGRFVNDAGGVLTSQGNTAVAASLTNRGLVQVETGTLTLGGNVSNTGTLALAGAGSGVTGSAIDNGGRIVGHGRIDNALLQQGTVRAEGGTLALQGALDLRNTSRLEVAPSSRLQVAGPNLRVIGDIVLEGGTGEGAAATLAVSGVLELNGRLQGQGRIEASGTRLAGSMQLGAGPSVVAGSLDSRRSGRIGLDAGAQLRFADAVTLRSGSELSLAAGASAAFDAALSLEAGARIVGDGLVTIGDALSIGDGIAELGFAGQLLFGSGSTYRAQIGATGADLLSAAAGIGFDGTLVLELLPGFVPTEGAQFSLFDAGQFGGGFAQIQLGAATLPEGLAWDFSSLYSQGVVGVTTAVPEVPAPWLMLGGLAAIGWRGWPRRTGRAR